MPGGDTPDPGDPGEARSPIAPPHRARGSGWRVVAALALSASLVLGSPGGPSLFSIVAPNVDEVVRFAGLRVMVRLPEDGRVTPGSLRVRLNGADVTGDLETASNGAFGELHGLLDGENLLEVEAEGASWWLDGRPFADRAALSVRVRRPTDLDRG